MKVNINEMNDRERIVLTKEQLQRYMNSGVVCILGEFGGETKYEVIRAPVIEVEEVLGE